VGGRGHPDYVIIRISEAKDNPIALIVLILIIIIIIIIIIEPFPTTNQTL
jgi:t-SNARE complex subunit (syntaxin)